MNKITFHNYIILLFLYKITSEIQVKGELTYNIFEIFV